MLNLGLERANSPKMTGQTVLHNKMEKKESADEHGHEPLVSEYEYVDDGWCIAEMVTGSIRPILADRHAACKLVQILQG